MYTYFANNKIIKLRKAADLRLNPSFIPLTAEQSDFLAAHPDASVHEVRHCTLASAHTMQAPPLEEYKSEKIKEMSDYSLATLGKHVSMYQFANAYISLNGGSIYDTETAQNHMKTYERIGAICREKYYSILSAIEKAATAAEVDDIVAAGKEEYDTIR